MAARGKQLRPLISRLSLLFFALCSSTSCVLAAGVVDNRGNALEGEAVRWWRVESRGEETRPQPAHVVRGCTATITPAPDLLRRQDQGQIQALSIQLQQVSEQSRAVSRASQQVSQSSQQLSQSLQQATQRLSETERQLASVRASLDTVQQASRSLSQAAAEASRRVDETRQSADRAIQQAIESASRSVNDAMMQSMASASRSFASVLAQASQSAASAADSATSLIQKAQAEATAVRGEASNQVQQAQGAALSVTQTALAVVGGIIGSSLLTIVAFILILRYRRKRRRSRMGGHTPNIGYPDLKGSSDNAVGGGRIGGYAASDDGSIYSTDDNGFRRDIKEPAAVAVRGSVNIGGPRGPNGRGTPGVGYALSYYGPQPGAQEKRNNITTNSNNAMSGTTATGGSSNNSGFQLSDPPKGKFTLFPRSNGKENLDSLQSGISTTVTTSSGGSGRATPQMTLQRTSKGFVPSLETWIRAGTVSPFATMKKGASPTAR